MDQKTYLKEMAKHAKRNSSIVKRDDLNQKKVQIKTFKKESNYYGFINSIDSKSLELYAQMMRDRYSDKNIDN
jgi:hypothetical protein|tara:strand:+ start:757 stop:975 length:219 start_codon:yes stop_codon:yes gene_type:complete